jgi:hypothetical protein
MGEPELSKSDLEALLPYARSANQTDLIKRRIAGHTMAKIEADTGVDRRTMYRALERVRRSAAGKGWSPAHDMTHTVPEGFTVKGVSTLYGADGQVTAQWVKSNRELELQEERLRAFVDGLCESLTPCKHKPVPKTIKHDPNLMSGIFIGDAHIGMRAFGVETRHADFDVDIGVQQLREAIDYLVEKAPSSETGMLVDVGDFMHANTQHNTTFSGTPLDVDTRHYRVMKAAGEVMQYMVDRMLTKFKRVILVIARGNHNTDAAGAVQLMMEFYYKREKRVHVLPVDGFYHYIEFGKWLLGVHHGDKQKPSDLAASMPRDMPEAWARTTHRMWCTGHYHKEMVRTFPGVKHKVFGALPPPDSWHASHGFAGDGEMEMITFRKEGGKHSTYTYEILQPRTEPDVRI